MKLSELQHNIQLSIQISQNIIIASTNINNVDRVIELCNDLISVVENIKRSQPLNKYLRTYYSTLDIVTVKNIENKLNSIPNNYTVRVIDLFEGGLIPLIIKQINQQLTVLKVWAREYNAHAKVTLQRLR